MPEETVKVEAPKPAKPSDREKALEQAVQDAIITIEDLTIRLGRMGIAIKGTTESVQRLKEALK